MKNHTFTLDSKYTQEEGTILLTGLQALVRLPLDQARADRRAGLNTGTFISGYRGSPVGGVDFLLEQNKRLLDPYNIHFEPGVNEDLAATAVFGSQIASLYPNPKFDGVVGMWYGKGPGVDRTGDSFRHANFAGVGPNGGVLAVAGDDPLCKSSTIPSHSEIALYDANMPVLYPGNVQEVIEMGRYGFELSRYCGQWAGFKFVTNVADSFSSAEIHPITQIIKPEWTFDGKPWAHNQNVNLLAPHSLVMEREMHEGRLEAAKKFAYANGLNKIVISTNDDRIGLIATGKTYYDLRDALGSVGLDDAALRKYGIRLLKIGMITPIEPTIVKEFARGLEEIFVVEEKRGFLELLIRDVLYNEPNRPRIVGKRDQDGNFLVKGHSILVPDEIVSLLAARLAPYVEPDQFKARLAVIHGPPKSVTLNVTNGAKRTPYFCSGCPHNRSTVVPDGAVVAGGIGCHSLALLMPDRSPLGLTQMGGEGAQWVGVSPFTDTEHIFQNIGDGTLFHSGYLAVRQAVAANVNITFKILYNGAVAMTGGQHADGEMAIPELTHALIAEGVKRVVVLSHDPKQFKDATLAKGTILVGRDELDNAQHALPGVKGVSVIIYDQPCATELRRNRKRGLIEEPKERIWINEAVCEGCGDCGEKSNCLSVFPVETEFGRKTQIHQASCNKDYTCIEGNCPAFVRVISNEEWRMKNKKATPHSSFSILSSSLPEPARLPAKSGNIYMMGIGGTGVVTTTQILATAALVDGKRINSLDQTGLSQKGGPVVSHLKVLDSDAPISSLIGAGEADAYLVFDVLSGTDEKNLRVATPSRTTAIVSSSKIPTGGMVKNKAVRFPEGDYLKGQIEAATDAQHNVYLDAIGLSEQLFGTHMHANLLVVGAAYQSGIIPLTPLAIEYAIELNGVKIEANKAAFRIGRLYVSNPERVLALTQPKPSELSKGTAPSTQAQPLIDGIGGSDELRRILSLRVDELIAYQDVDYARKYVSFVEMVVRGEADFGRTQLSETVARYLFKLMAYKDEYEVARLHLRSDMKQALADQFGDDADIEYLLHPPSLKALGMKKKIAFGRWFDGGYKTLVKMKHLRGTRLDPFGRDEVRVVERQLIAEYQAQMTVLVATLSAANYDNAVAIAALPDMVRGYDEIKLENVRLYRAEMMRRLGLQRREGVKAQS